MDALEQTIKHLKARDEKKRRELDAILNGMPVVQRYVAQNRETWEQRRGSSTLDQPRIASGTATANGTDG